MLKPVRWAPSSDSLPVTVGEARGRRSLRWGRSPIGRRHHLVVSASGISTSHRSPSQQIGRHLLGEYRRSAKRSTLNRQAAPDAPRFRARSVVGLGARVSLKLFTDAMIGSSFHTLRHNPCQQWHGRILSVRGEVDIATVGELEEKIFEIGDSGLILDLTATDFMDSKRSPSARLHTHGLRRRGVDPASPFALSSRLLEVTGLMVTSTFTRR